MVEKLNVSESRLLENRARHRTFWDACQEKASQNTEEILQQLAGTSEIFLNNGKLIRIAKKVEPQTIQAFPEGDESGKQTLSTFLKNTYIPSRTMCKTHALRLRSTVNRLVAFLGKDITFDELNEADICEFLMALHQTRGAVTVNHSRQVLLTLWKNAYDYGMCHRSPRSGLIRRMPEEIDPPEAWTAEECNKMFSTAASWEGMIEGIPAGKWWLSLLLTIYWSGCRIGALIQTPINCYQPGGGILVRKQKNRRPQWYNLPTSCREVIDDTNPHERTLLWPWPQHSRTLWTKFRQIVEVAGIPSPKTGRQLFHRMRRTTLSLCAAVDPVVAQRQAGHADYATTLKHYIDPRIARGQSAADILPEPILSNKHTEPADQ